MANGPGKYDHVASAARVATDAEGVVVIVIGGRKGSGFSVQGSEAVMARLPELLETMATQIRQDVLEALAPSSPRAPEPPCAG